MFGFGRLASYDYFVHLERELVRELGARGQNAATWVVDVPPTASIRRRASRLAELVASTSTSHEGPIHLVGHSTGGVDVRLVASPDASLGCDDAALTWLPRLASVTTLSTPHYGTPLAAFFATVSGQRMLYALSAFTFIGLTLGSPPLAATSALVVAIARIDHALGLDIHLLDQATERLLRVLDDAGSPEVRSYLDAIGSDQGAIVQVMPEAMDLFQATVRDRPGVHYQCTVSMARLPSAMTWVRQLTSPWGALSTTLFAALREITSRIDARYPCAPLQTDDRTQSALVSAFGPAPGVGANDGVVPMRSQLHGHVVWAGYADHLDLLGHFDGRTPRASRRGGRRSSGTQTSSAKGAPDTPHVDWLRSGAGFDQAHFTAMTRGIVNGMTSSSS